MKKKYLFAMAFLLIVGSMNVFGFSPERFVIELGNFQEEVCPPECQPKGLRCQRAPLACWIEKGCMANDIIFECQQCKVAACQPDLPDIQFSDDSCAIKCEQGLSGDITSSPEWLDCVQKCACEQGITGAVCGAINYLKDLEKMDPVCLNNPRYICGNFKDTSLPNMDSFCQRLNSKLYNCPAYKLMRCN